MQGLGEVVVVVVVGFVVVVVVVPPLEPTGQEDDRTVWIHALETSGNSQTIAPPAEN